MLGRSAPFSPSARIFRGAKLLTMQEGHSEVKRKSALAKRKVRRSRMAALSPHHEPIEQYSARITRYADLPPGVQNPTRRAAGSPKILQLAASNHFRRTQIPLRWRIWLDAGRHGRDVVLAGPDLPHPRILHGHPHRWLSEFPHTGGLRDWRIVVRCSSRP